MDRLKSATATILHNCGFEVGPHKVNRLVVTFRSRVERNGIGFFEFLANSMQLDDGQRRRALANPQVSRAIAYADPTGETAVCNVMKGRS
jgi:hypothetical protein